MISPHVVMLGLKTSDVSSFYDRTEVRAFAEIISPTLGLNPLVETDVPTTQNIAEELGPSACTQVYSFVINFLFYVVYVKFNIQTRDICAYKWFMC